MNEKGYPMDNLQRVNLMLERSQREALECIARKKGRSVSDLVREYVTQGIESESTPQQERLETLENTRALTNRILKRRNGKPLSDAVEVMDQIREERDDELLSH
jgi:plasmid stability protein